MNKEEIKNEFINCIEGTHTLNLAISVLEEREFYKSIIKEVREYILKEDEWVKNSDYRLLKTDKLLEILDKENKE